MSFDKDFIFLIIEKDTGDFKKIYIVGNTSEGYAFRYVSLTPGWREVLPSY